MPESPLKGPVPEDLLAVTGHCCSVRLTRLAELDDGIDFTPDAAARAAFARLQTLTNPEQVIATPGDSAERDTTPG
ncbi:MAG: hypothetical protein K0S46_2531 [Moraxellaceae bacterium]|jgi:hypothetical protein|nr:hypothetical protein [Moraxellaceae bacterium]